MHIVCEFAKDEAVLKKMILLEKWHAYLDNQFVVDRPEVSSLARYEVENTWLGARESIEDLSMCVLKIVAT